MNDLGIPTNTEDRLNRALQELNVLYEVSCAMRTTLELDHILYIILTGVTSHSGLGYNRALLFLLNSKTKQLECRMVIGPESGEHATKVWDYIENSRQKMEDLIQADKINFTVTQSSLYRTLRAFRVPLDSPVPSLLKTAFEKGIPWHLPPEEISKLGDDALFEFFPSKELVIMPLRAKGIVNGLILADNIYTRKPITDADIRIFSMLADQAGLAIENSRLYEMVVQKSRTDSITNLWNHGYFQEKLAAEIDTAGKMKAPLTLTMIDIDNFKQINDTCGHQHGDTLLKEIAQILRNDSREMDYVCRYGGEEFAIILIQTGQKQGLEVAERLRKRVEGHGFLGPNGEKLKITISMGQATFPNDADSKEDLISSADKAMYIAKFSGKNRVCTASPQTTP